MSDTKIEWATKSWNPVTGCTPISEGCKNCYAKRMSKRMRGRYGYPADDPFRVSLHINKLDEPSTWVKPQKVFVCSMGDLFHKDVPIKFFSDIMDTIIQNQKHTFMLLTKRPERMLELLEDRAEDWKLALPWQYKIPIHNLWLGVTAENQRTADERIPILLQIPAAKRFVSVEPMLGPVDIRQYLSGGTSNEQPIKREDCLSNSIERGVRDRRSREDMEDSETRMGQMEQGNPLKQMQEGSGRTSNATGISSDQGDGKRETLSPGSTSPRVLSLLRPDTEGNNGQSQERKEIRQRTEEPRTSHLFGTDPTCNQGVRFSKQERRSGTILWCIAGPETGPKARPTNIGWIRSLADQCKAGDIPFFDKRDVLGETLQEWPL